MKQPIHMPARRSSNPKLLEALKPFIPSRNDSDRDGTSGNIQYIVNGEYESKTGKRTGGMLGDKTFYESVSAPMLLSRLMAGFEGLTVEAQGQSAYKTTWFTALVHPMSGNVVTFYDWKGAASIGSTSLTEYNERFLCDLQALLLALCDDAFPHPYDGCRVGEIA